MLSSISSINFKKINNSFFVFRPKALSNLVKKFVNGFSGEIAYAVKANPSRFLIECLHFNGIRSFDVASINEVKLIKNIFHDSEIFFMNPVKSRSSIAEAYFEYGVRNFCIDSLDELKKILQETNFAKDLIIHIRLSVPNNYAKLKLSKKHGVSASLFPSLIKEVKKKVLKVGVCFHPGSQCMDPLAYSELMQMVFCVIKSSGVKVNYFNVGGGFPSIYSGMTPPPLEDYFDIINKKFNEINFEANMTLMCEPGRSLAAECMSLIVRVELRKGNKLYINDGTYGNLCDVGKNNFVHPVRLIGKKNYKKKLLPFSFFGPTCDSGDFIKGPFLLPENIEEGDYIEIGQMGAYSYTMRSDFNGFLSPCKVFLVRDEPILSVTNINCEQKKNKKELV